MESTRFDHFTSALAGRQDRRGVLRSLAGAIFGGAGIALLAREATQAKGKGKKKKRKNPPPAPRPKAPTCSDGIKNGSETGVDCGGPHCPPCAVSQTCRADTDCVTGRCGDGLGNGNTCQSCASDGVCGRDGNGGCLCDTTRGVCYTDSTANRRYVGDCAECPANWGCRAFPEIRVCYPPCGANAG